MRSPWVSSLSEWLRQFRVRTADRQLLMSDKQQVEVSFASPLRIVLEQAQPPPQEYRAVFTWQVGQFIFKGENLMNTMQAGTIATLSVEWKDKYGNPAPVQAGSMKWVSSDEKILKVTAATGNPQISNVYSQGPIGPVQVQATGDADLGDGVKTITATCDISVIAGEAFAGEMKFSQTPAQGQPGPNPAAKAR